MTTEPARSGARMPQLVSPSTATTDPTRSGAHALQLLSPCTLEPMRHN